MKTIMSLLIFGAGLFDTILSGNSNVIPTREEQANLLTTVQEVFDQIKILVNTESNATDESVTGDFEKIAERARRELNLLEELTLIKLSLNNNAVCMLDSKTMIQDLIQRASRELNECIELCFDAITTNSNRLRNTTEFATGRGENFLDTLQECSKKPGLQVINCYKKVIANDVVPVKSMLLHAINIHKDGHLRVIQIRNEANDCIDKLLERYNFEVSEVLEDALKCS